MYAILDIQGKQYKVAEKQKLLIDKVSTKKGDNITFSNVLLLKNDKEHFIGQPNVEGATVEAKIVDHVKEKKIIIFKKIRRHNYRRKKGHRQEKTLVEILAIKK